MDAIAPQPSGGTPVDDGQAQRTDFEFVSQGDALDSQLARRLENPGYNLLPDGAGGYVYPAFQAVPLLDTATLASRFVLPSSLGDTGAALEQYLPGSLLLRPENSAAGTGPSLPLRTSPYPADAYGAPAVVGDHGSYGTWFSDHFDYLAENPDPVSAVSYLTMRPLRALLVSRNPVSNLGPTVNMNLLPATVREPYPPTSTELMPDYTNAIGGARVAPRTSINTASFGELWRGFTLVMAESRATATGPVLSTPFGAAPLVTIPASPGLPADTYDGSKFNAADFTPVTGVEHPYRMFRSSLRDPSALGAQSFVTPNAMMLLRSALAAVNAEALRDLSNPVVPYHDIPLTAEMYDATIPAWFSRDVTVRVYGSKPQPFITEVYANTDTVETGPASEPANPPGTLR
jgi:hypothetical protein